MTVGALRTALWILLLGKLLAGWGVQWDIEWHVVVGRDTFWIPPHVMTYAGVSIAVLVSFGVLAIETLVATRRRIVGGPVERRRVLGLVGTRGFHLAAWGIALTVLAAPIDDLWHRLFGLDVTLWSPPHLLGIVGSAFNTWACLLIAREVYGAGAARTVVLVAAGAMLYGNVHLIVQPANLTAYRHGGVLFYTLPLLSALFLPTVLVPIARLSGRAWTPLAAVVLVILVGVAGHQIAQAGFDLLQPVSVIEDEIRKDPTSPIALAQLIARQNGRPPGRTGGWAHWVSLLPVAALVAVDARRRPVAASVAYGGVLFFIIGWLLAGLPAFAGRVPGAADTALALAATIAAGVAGGALGRTIADALAGRPAQARSMSSPNSRVSVPV